MKGTEVLRAQQDHSGRAWGHSVLPGSALGTCHRAAQIFIHALGRQCLLYRAD